MWRELKESRVLCKKYRNIFVELMSKETQIHKTGKEKEQVHRAH